MSQSKFPLKRFLDDSGKRLSDGLAKAVDNKIKQNQELEKADVDEPQLMSRAPEPAPAPLYVPPQYPG